MTMDSLYIADHICRIDYEYCDRPGLQADSLWRIASHVELFGSALDASGSLTLEQTDKLNVWIEKFRQSPEGAAAIDQIKSAMRAGYRQPERRDLFAVAPWQRLEGLR